MFSIKRLIYIIVLAMFSAPCLASYADMEEFYLDNGLQVIVIPDHKAPIIKQMIWYKTGAVDEPVGKGGLAHLLEHLMFRGSHKVPGSAFNEIIADNGGISNAFTAHDYTAYHEFVDISRLEVAMALEADRMNGLNFDEDAFRAERDIVFQERQQRVANNPLALFAENLERVFRQNSPYARPVSGTETEIKNLTAEDVMAFYRKYYTPGNAVLVLSGDIDTPTAKQLAQKYFGPLKGCKSASSEAFLLPTERTLYRLESFMPEIASIRLIRKYLVPSLKTDKRQAYALSVFSKYLGEGDNSYLNQNLVLKGLALGADSFYDSLSRGPGVFAISLIPSEKTDPAQAEKLLTEQLEQALQALDETRLEKEKRKILAELVYIREDPEIAAMLVGQLAALGIDISEIEAYEQNIRAVTLKDVQAAVRSMIDSATTINGIIRPLPPQQEKK